jgi:MYXO-CTERM domain-containing protein
MPSPTGTATVVGDLGAPAASACDVSPGPARSGVSWLGGVALAGLAIARRRRQP